MRRSLFPTVSAAVALVLLGAGGATAGPAVAAPVPSAAVASGTAATGTAGQGFDAGVSRRAVQQVVRAKHTDDGPISQSTSTSRPTNPSLRANAVATADIRVTYSPGFTPQAQAAFQAAVDIWKTQVRSSVPITISATWEPLEEGVLGQAGPTGFRRDFTGAPRANTYYPDALANKLAGRDLDPATPEIDASFNSSFPSWYLGTDGHPAFDDYDFESVVLHELAHGLGLVGTLDGLNPPDYETDTGKGYWGLMRPGDYPLVFDRLVVDGLGRDALDTSVYGQGTTGLGGLIRGATGGSQWKGAAGVLGASGARPKLYSPSYFAEGSSVSHLDENTYPAGSANALMTPYLQNGESAHDPGPIVRGMFTDMGWGAASCAASTATTTDRYIAGANARRGTFAMTGGVTFDLPMAGQAGVPASGVSAVLVTLDVAKPSASGYLATGSGCNGATASAQQYTSGISRSATMSVPLDSLGRIQVRLSAGAANVSVYVHGWYAPSGTTTGLFKPLPRTRAGGPVVKAGTPVDVATNGVAGLPSTGVDAVLLQVTVLSPTASGAVAVGPGGVNPPAAQQSYVTGKAITQLVVAKRSADGKVRVTVSAGSATVLLDVWGYYGASATGGSQPYHRVVPKRVLNASTSPDVTFTIPGLPANTRSVSLVTMVVGPTGTGYLGAAAGGTGGTALPCVVQFAGGNNVGNLVVVPVGPNNTVRLKLSTGSAKLYVDLLGYHATT